MNLVSDIIARNFDLRDGELCVGGIPVSAITREFGTPVFVYDHEILVTRLAALRRALPSSFQISYSVKANPSQELLRIFLSCSCGLEIASAGELEQALAAGCPSEKIIFAGPGKTVAELQKALGTGIKEIHVESMLELNRIQSLCREKSLHAAVALRVNPGSEAQGGAMRMGGKPAPFGVDEENIEPLIAEILDDPYLSFKGIHLFTGTQILDHRVLVVQYRKAIEIARRIAHRFGCPIQTVDFGGGLGIPYFAGEKPLNLEEFAAELDRLDSELRADPIFCNTEFMVEPGRFLAGEAGVYVTTVNDIKVSRGKKFLICDGGMNHHLAASGNLGQTIKRNYPVALLNKLSAPATEAVEVVGPLCTPLDVLARNAELPAAEVGDIFGVFQSGAYARSASPLGFLSHRTPPEVLVKDGAARLIRDAGEPQDYLEDQRCTEVAK